MQPRSRALGGDTQEVVTCCGENTPGLVAWCFIVLYFVRARLPRSMQTVIVSPFDARRPTKISVPTRIRLTSVSVPETSDVRSLGRYGETEGLDPKRRKLEIPRANASVAVVSATENDSKAAMHNSPLPAKHAMDQALGSAIAMKRIREQEQAEEPGSVPRAAAMSTVEERKRVEVKAAAAAGKSMVDKDDGMATKARTREQEKKERQEDLRRMQQDPFYVPHSIFGPTRELMLNVSSDSRKRCRGALVLALQ